MNESEEDSNGPNKKKRVNNNRDNHNNHKNSGTINKKAPKVPLSNLSKIY